MAYNWSQFPKHDKLNHAQALSDQMKKIRETFNNSKTKVDALNLQNMLNNFYSPSNSNSIFNTSNVVYQKIEQALDLILSGAHGKSFSSALQKLNINQDTSWKQKYLINSTVQLKTLQTQMKKLQSEIMSTSGFSTQKVQQLNKEYNKILSQINSGSPNTFGASDKIISQYNKLVTSVFGDGVLSALGKNAEVLVSLLNSSLDNYANMTVDNIVDDILSRMVGGASQGSTPKIATTGMKQERVSEFLNNNKRWNHRDEFGNLLWQQTTADKVDVILTLGDEKPYYISVKETPKGSAGTIEFVDSTRLASLFTSDLVLEEYSRAYLRFAGWKWGLRRSKNPYAEKNLYSLAQKLCAILSISGEGFQNTTAEIIAVKSNTGFVCYSIQDIASKFLSDTSGNIAQGIEVQGLPKKEDLRPRPITTHFLNVHVNVRIKNLQKMLGY